ncbi:hypothetical protein BSLG_005956 [Batrachochytrium salamandrivorans]|nr:hypothetical protein BSLG_005956 [Batrachochytrium salamandrivorans]
MEASGLRLNGSGIENGASSQQLKALANWSHQQGSDLASKLGGGQTTASDISGERALLSALMHHRQKPQPLEASWFESQLKRSYLLDIHESFADVPSVGADPVFSIPPCYAPLGSLTSLGSLATLLDQQVLSIHQVYFQRLHQQYPNSVAGG